MRQIAAIILLIPISSMTLQAQPAVVQLRDVNKVYVGSFGEGEGSNVIRNKVITYLVKSHQIDVVEDAAVADAILVGAGQVTKQEYYSASTKDGNVTAGGGSTDHATAGVRLVSKDQRILWADDVSNSVWAMNATSSIADRISKNLLKAIAQDAKRRNARKN
jgi:hypothetical protein